MGTRSTAPEPRGLPFQLAETAHRAQKIKEKIISSATRPGTFLPRILGHGYQGLQGRKESTRGFSGPVLDAESGWKPTLLFELHL